MNRLLRATALVFAALILTSRVRAVWSRSIIAEFPRGAQGAKLLRLAEGPAIAVFENPKTLDLFRRHDGDWTRTSVPLPYDEATDIESCACRGDGVVRLYVTYSADPHVTEITPGPKGWGMEDFEPDGERLTGVRPASAYTDAIAWAISHVDHRPSLFIRRRLVQKIFECRWNAGWRCSPAAETAAYGFWGDLRANIHAWSANDMLLDGGVLQKRDPSGWAKVIDFHSAGAVASRSVLRRLYVFWQKHQVIDLDSELLPIRSIPMLEDEWAPVNARAPRDESRPDDPVVQQIAVRRAYDAAGAPRGKHVETLFGTLEDHQIHELRWSGGRWKDQIVAALSGDSQKPLVGDARDDGLDRVYALVDDRADSDRRTTLYELTYYPRRAVVLAPDPDSASLAPADRHLLGEMMRAEMGRHGHLAIVDTRSRAVAREERSLTEQGAGGNAVPDAAVRCRIEEKNGLYTVSAQLSTNGTASAMEFKASPSARAELPQAVLALARQVAEDWPQNLAEGAGSPATARAAPTDSAPSPKAAATGDCDVLVIRYKAVWSDPSVTRAIDVALNSHSRQERTDASVTSMAALGIPKNSDGLAQARRLIASSTPWCRYWGYQIISYLELAGVRDANSERDLVRGLQDPDASSRRGVVLALGAYTDATLLPSLYRIFSADPSPDVRMSAAISLSGSGLYTPEQRRRMLPIFLRVLKDPSQDHQTREWAAHAMSDITGQGFGMDEVRWQAWITAHP